MGKKDGKRWKIAENRCSGSAVGRRRGNGANGANEANEANGLR